MSIVAYRISTSKTTGQKSATLAMRTFDWPLMYRWLERTRNMRNGRPKTLWVEQERQPASIFAPKRRYRKTEGRG